MNEENLSTKKITAGRWLIRGVWIVVLIGLVYFTYEAIEAAHTSARFSNTKNDLKLLGLAAHNYHDTFNQFPITSRNEEGIEMHGWQISMMPFVESTTFFAEIDFHKPWDAEINRKWFQQVIPAYLSDGISPTSDPATGFGLTSFSANRHLIDYGLKTSLKDIKDGASTTLLFGEIRDELPPWGKPGNIRDPALGISKSPKGFGGTFYNGCLFTMADGAVRHISDKVDTKVIEALGTPAGGETIKEEEF